MSNDNVRGIFKFDNEAAVVAKYDQERARDIDLIKNARYWSVTTIDQEGSGTHSVNVSHHDSTSFLVDTIIQNIEDLASAAEMPIRDALALVSGVLDKIQGEKGDS